MNTQSNDPLLGGGALLQEVDLPPPPPSSTSQEIHHLAPSRTGQQEAAGGKGLPPCFVLEQEDQGDEEVDWSKYEMYERDWTSEGGNVEVDKTPLQNQLKKNKESLAVKLKLRRPMTALVEQGIMPQYKTSPSLHEQKTKLERAQMGDRLRQKIASRPDRQENFHSLYHDVSNISETFIDITEKIRTKPFVSFTARLCKSVPKHFLTLK